MHEVFCFLIGRAVLSSLCAAHWLNSSVLGASASSSTLLRDCGLRAFGVANAPPRAEEASLPASDANVPMPLIPPKRCWSTFYAEPVTLCARNLCETGTSIEELTWLAAPKRPVNERSEVLAPTSEAPSPVGVGLAPNILGWYPPAPPAPAPSLPRLCMLAMTLPPAPPAPGKFSLLRSDAPTAAPKVESVFLAALM